MKILQNFVAFSEYMNFIYRKHRCSHQQGLCLYINLLRKFNFKFIIGSWGSVDNFTHTGTSLILNLKFKYIMVNNGVVCQWWIIPKPPEISGNRPRRFPAGFQIFLLIEFFLFIIDGPHSTNKKFGNLPETSAAGFRRFPVDFRIIHH